MNTAHVPLASNDVLKGTMLRLRRTKNRDELIEVRCQMKQQFIIVLHNAHLNVMPSTARHITSNIEREL